MSPRTGPLPHRPRASQRSQPQRGALSWALSWAPGAGPPPRTPPPSCHRPRKRAPPRDRPRGAQKRRAWGAAQEPEGFRAGGDLEGQTRRDCGGTGRRTGRGRVCPPRSARSSASRGGVTLSHGSAPSAPGSGAAQSGLRPGTASGPRLRVPCRRCAQGGRRSPGPPELRVAARDPPCSGQLGSRCQFRSAALPRAGEPRRLITVPATRETGGRRAPACRTPGAALPPSRLRFHSASKPFASLPPRGVQPRPPRDAGSVSSSVRRHLISCPFP